VLPKPGQSSALLRIRIPGRADHVEELSLEKGDSKLDLALPRPGTLAGLVLDPSGAPAPRARLEVSTGAGMDRLVLEADASGAFQVALDPGSFDLRADEDPARGQGWCRAEGTIEADERKRMDLRLTQTDTLRGRALAAARRWRMR
jgi:hypothetical protein